MQGLPTRVNLTPVKFNLLSSLLPSSLSAVLLPFSHVDLARVAARCSYVVSRLVLRFSTFAALFLPSSSFFFYPFLSFFFVSVTFDARQGIRAINTISIRRRFLIIASKANQLDTQFVFRLIELLFRTIFKRNSAQNLTIVVIDASCHTYYEEHVVGYVCQANRSHLDISRARRCIRVAYRLIDIQVDAVGDKNKRISSGSRYR